jgi:hypothetical protein
MSWIWRQILKKNKFEDVHDEVFKEQAAVETFGALKKW